MALEEGVGAPLCPKDTAQGTKSPNQSIYCLSLCLYGIRIAGFHAGKGYIVGAGVSNIMDSFCESRTSSASVWWEGWEEGGGLVRRKTMRQRDSPSIITDTCSQPSSSSPPFTTRKWLTWNIGWLKSLTSPALFSERTRKAALYKPIVQNNSTSAGAGIKKK